MGSSQSKTDSASVASKRHSRADKLRHALGRKGGSKEGASETPPNGDRATPGTNGSDYETPIYETGGRTAATKPAAPPPAPAPAEPTPPPPPTMTTESGGNGTASTTPAPRTKSAMPATVPCQYRTGKTLGSGTYAIVKEAIHITTGKYYACKVINKRLMEGREHMVRNEIAVLKRVSSGCKNIVTLHDYFETAHNLYLVFDLCTGGELFDRICAKGNYYEADAADLVRTIFKAIQHIHDSGIVHRDLKPENLLFRTPAEEADIMVADFGLSRIMDEEKHALLTEICGTPGYMAPEIFKKTGHSKPVDIWAMGVVTYFLLAGYTPFDRDSQQQEMEAIIAGDYKFEPEEYWQNVSETAKDFVRYCLTVDPNARPTVAQVLKHKWLASDEPYFVPDPTRTDGRPADLLPNVKKAFNAKQLWRKAAFSIKAVNRMTLLVGAQGDAVTMRENIKQYKEESARENLDDTTITYQQDIVGTNSDKAVDDLHQKLADVSLNAPNSPAPNK